MADSRFSQQNLSGFLAHNLLSPSAQLCIVAAFRHCDADSDNIHTRHAALLSRARQAVAL